MNTWPGVAPKLLLEQVKNTAPYIFDDSFAHHFEPTRLLRLATQHGCLLDPNPDLSEYFMLLACAHYATVATFVPTDVDNTIRIKLWSRMDAHERFRAGRWVLDSRAFDFSCVSERWTRDRKGRTLHGHRGEWFSMAVPAYATNRHFAPALAREIQAAIVAEIEEEESIFRSLYENGEGLKLATAATLIAHNLGDLDRVTTAWGLEEPFFDLFNLGQETSSRLWLRAAGIINRDLTAVENHRHFSLRKPRALRGHRDLLLPIGPFFDEWGARVASHPALSPEKIGTVIEALLDGWRRVEGFGYASALRGIENSIQGGLTRVGKCIPAHKLRFLKSGTLRQRISESRWRFEMRWNHRALEICEREVKTFNSAAPKKPSGPVRNLYKNDLHTAPTHFSTQLNSLMKSKI